MPSTASSAPGKAILLGEHAVVYGHPAVAVPVNQVQAKVYITPAPGKPSGTVFITAPDIHFEDNLTTLDKDHSFRVLFELVLNELNIHSFPAFNLKIKSSIPIASGLGSGAAVSIAILRGVTEFLGCSLENEKISALAFKVEKIYHGTPSGIDNTVITYEKPIFFKRGDKIEILTVLEPIFLLVADSGISSQTAEVVLDLRRRWQANPEFFNPIFEAIGKISLEGKSAVEKGDINLLGRLMNENHNKLQILDVSNNILDKMVNAALQAGAIGAKLSGAGRGGNMISLVSKNSIYRVEEALKQAGAKSVIHSKIKSS